MCPQPFWLEPCTPASMTVYSCAKSGLGSAVAGLRLSCCTLARTTLNSCNTILRRIDNINNRCTRCQRRFHERRQVCLRQDNRLQPSPPSLPEAFRWRLFPTDVSRKAFAGGVSLDVFLWRRFAANDSLFFPFRLHYANRIWLGFSRRPFDAL